MTINFGKHQHTSQYEGSQYEAILGLDFFDKHAKSIKPQEGRIVLESGETVEITKHSWDTNRLHWVTAGERVADFCTEVPPVKALPSVSTTAIIRCNIDFTLKTEKKF